MHVNACRGRAKGDSIWQQSVIHKEQFSHFSVFSLLQVVDTLRKLPDAKAMCALFDFVRDGSFSIQPYRRDSE